MVKKPEDRSIGAITDVVATTESVLAVGLDRFLRVYDHDYMNKEHKILLWQKLTTLCLM